MLVDGKSGSDEHESWVLANVGDGGSFSLDAGDTTGADGNGGSITVVAGHANDGGSNDGGSISVTAGHSKGTERSDDGGSISVNAGEALTGNGGNIDVATGYLSTATSSGSFVFKTPNSGAKGISGAFTFSTGTTSSGDSGGYSMTTGDALNGKSGSMTLKLGTGNVGDGGSFSLDVGDTIQELMVMEDLLLS